MATNNNMICDMETGVCGPAGDDTTTMEFIDRIAGRWSRFFGNLSISTGITSICTR